MDYFLYFFKDFNSMEERVIDRIFKYMSFKGLNEHRFSVFAGLTYGMLGKAKTNQGNLRTDSVEKILVAFPELDARWLITGVGNMENSPYSRDEDLRSNTSIVAHGTTYLEEIVTLQKELLKQKEEKIVSLQEKIAELESKNLEKQ